MTDVVVASLEAWDAVWRRNQYLITELLRADPGLRVLFVEPAADPLHSLSRGWRPRRGRGLRRAPEVAGVDRDRLWLYQPTKLLPRRLDPRADRRLSRATVAAARRLAMAAPVLWVNDPAAANLLRATGWPALYDVTDDWLVADRTDDEHRRLVSDEAILLDRCAQVVVCSPALATSKGAHREVRLVTNAVDVDRYRARHDRPADLPTGPVALYVGTVHPDRFDVPLLAATAQAVHGTGTLVVVGPVVDVARDDLAELARLGVRCLGARDWESVPAYLQHSDVLLVPHLVNAFTDSLDPIKLYEYLAVGRPVVSTPVAGFRERTDAHVRAVESADFPDAVRDALLGSRQDVPPVAALADVPTWSGQAALMAEALAATAASRPTRPR
ncbi:glycosyltransferase [Cellulosimicrobium arenosum]|uniref:Glycosyltransferase n=1 Tax=Cellulosimicrobium arenosum TaxID=2708133 RepID=A0A927IZ07_9MICO|nr:glycosyltransferase [Cellulosimicrobium arenosum]MBD8078966.1 glycosyltransferase [Cellulosimicrobium arenosum]